MDFKQESLEDLYDLGENLGSGQYAVVKKICSKYDQQEFAAKFIRKRRGAGRRGARMEDIENEVDILCQIDHHHIIKLYDVYETSMDVVLLLELVSGGELFDYVAAKDKLSEEEATFFLQQILDAVQYLHENSIVHLDLKPENVMLLTPTSLHIKLIDFGISRRLRSGQLIKAMQGTPEFVAPEVLNFDALSPATDMWSIGVITYILLSGCSPFLGETKQQTYHNIMSVNYSLATTDFAGTSELAKDFISKLFVKNSKNRSTAAECLCHPWIQPLEDVLYTLHAQPQAKEQEDERKTAVVNVNKLKKFQARNRWKQSMKVVTLCNRLSRSLILRTESSDIFGSRSAFNGKGDNFVMTALFCACEEGNVYGIRELLGEAQNIDINQANQHGETAVHMAASGGFIDILNYLQEKGATLDVLDKNGDSALYYAARQGHADVVSYLSSSLVQLNYQNKMGESAVHVAARYGHTHIIDLICQLNADVNIQDNLGETAVHAAAWHGFATITQLLCLAGANLLYQNRDGESALHCACLRGNQQCVAVMLEYSAPLDLVDRRNNTALHLACKRHHVFIAATLIQAGCNTDITDQDGETVLHCCSRDGVLAIVYELCEAKADMDKLNKDSLCALHLASRAGHTEIVRCLLLAGASPDIQNKDGVTPGILALAQGFSDISNLLNRVRADRREAYIQQLLQGEKSLSCIKLKMFGSSGGGKTTLIDSLKCGLFGSFFRRSRQNSTSSNNQMRHKSGSDTLNSAALSQRYGITNPCYTCGIGVHQVNISGVGELSIWDFSGYPPYYTFYDHFLGDIQCLHAVVFSLTLPPDEQLRQVLFWINFICLRISPTSPLGECGMFPERPYILLIATHADKAGCVRNSRGEYVSENASFIHDKIQYMFSRDVQLYERVFVIDSQLVNSAEMKSLKTAISELKVKTIQDLPKTSGFLEATISQLPSWRRSSISFPVLPWHQFTEYIRGRVNPLASDEHLHLLMKQLQLTGEVVYLESQTVQDLVILTPSWLCGSTIIGRLINHDRFVSLASTPESLCAKTACFNVDDFQQEFSDTDALDLLQVFEALDVCTQCDTVGEIIYEFPCLNILNTRPGIWDKYSMSDNNFSYGGLRICPPITVYGQLEYLFAKLQVQLRRVVVQEMEEPDSELFQWYNGSKFMCGKLETLVLLNSADDYVEVRLRGPRVSNISSFYFLEDLIHIIEQVFTCACPSLCLERLFLSPHDLKSHLLEPHVYTGRDMYLMQLDEEHSSYCGEQFVDIVCLGSDQILQTVSYGPDLHVSHIPMHVRRTLCKLLDPPDPMGKDWCLLALSLGLEQSLPTLDSNIVVGKQSKMDSVLTEFSLQTEQRNSIRDLIQSLRELGRVDAADAILSHGPLFKVFINDDHASVEARHSVVLTSSHTLSNLSR